MPRTPDRFPGEREDEGIILRDQGPAGLNNGDPTAAGGVRFVTNQIRLRDGFGAYNGRPVFVSASAAPAAANDGAAGFSVGMLWLRISTGVLYVCQDSSTGAAVWTSVVRDGDKGDITVSADGTSWTIDNDVVTNGKLANVASPSLKGRTTPAAGDPEDLSLVNSTSASWNTATPGSLSVERAALTGDVTASANSNATTIANNAVTNVKAADMASPRLKGRTTAGAGDPEDLNLVNSTSATWNTGTGGSVSIERAALTGVVDAGANSNTTTFGAGVDGAGLVLSGGNTALDVVGSTSIVVTSDQVQRAALTGDVTAAQNSNATTIANDAVSNAKAANVPSPSLKGRTTATTGDPEDLTLVNSTTNAWNTATGGSVSIERAALTGDVTAGANSNATTIASNAVTNAKAADMAANTVKGNDTASTGDPVDIAVGANTVLGRQGANIVAAAVATAQLADDAVTNAKLANVTSPSLKGRTTATTGDPEDLTLVNSTSNTWNTATGGSLSLERAALTGDITAPANSNTTAIAAGVIVDADVNAAAAIAQTKTGALTGDVTKASGSDVTAIAAGVIVDADVNASAAIALSKLAAQAANTLVANPTASSAVPSTLAVAADSIPARVGGNLVSHPLSTLAGAGLTYATGVVDVGGSTSIIAGASDLQRAALTGDVTAAQNSNATTIAANAVDNTKAADMAARSIKGRADGAGSGDPTDLTGAQVGAIIRFENLASDTTASGSIATYAVASGTNILTFNGTTCTINGFSAPAESGQFLVVRHIGAGSLTLVQDSTTATAAADRMNFGLFTQNTSPVVLGTSQGGQESVLFIYTGSRWQWVNNAIALASVLNSRLANVPSPSLKGRTTATAGAPEDLTLVNSTTTTWNTATGGSLSVERAALTGDVTAAANSNTTTIAANAVDNTKAADMASPRLKGRTTAGTGDPEDLTLTNSTSVSWNTATGGTVSVERAALTGDVTAPANSNSTTIANDAVSNAKLANVASPSLKGRTTATAGDPEDLTLVNSTTNTWNSATGGSISLERAALTGDITAPANSNTTAIAAGVIVDADVNASAAIALSKLAAQAANTLVANPTASSAVPSTLAVAADSIPARVGGNLVSHPLSTLAGAGLTYATGVVDVGGSTSIIAGASDLQRAALTGDVTAAQNSNATTIANDAVTNAKLANVTSPSLKGRTTATTGDPEDLTLVNSTSNSWNTATGGSISLERAALTGDVTAPANSNATTIANDAVTNAKLANVSPGTVKGLQITAGGAGDPVDLTGPELGELLRIDTRVDDASTSGTGAPYSVAAQTNWVRFTALTGAYTLEGCDATASGKLIIWHVEPGVTGTLVLNHNSVAVTNALRFFCPGAANLTLGAGDTAVTVYTSNRHRVVSVARAGFALTDGDKGDITVATGGTAWSVDNDIVTNAKLANVTSPSLKGRTTAATGDPEDLTLVSSTTNAWNTATGGSISLERAALTGDVTATANSNATTIANNAVTNAKAADMASPRLKGRTTAATGDPEDLTLTNSTSATWNTTTGGAISVERAALTGDVTAPANSNATTIANNAVTDAKLRQGGALTVVGRSANSTGNVADIAATAASGAVLRESGSTIGFGTIATAGIAANAVTNAKAAQMAANTVKANATAALADPADFAVGTNTLVGRVAGNIVAAQAVNAQIAGGALSTVKGVASGGVAGTLQDLTGTQLVEFLRWGTTQDLVLTTDINNDVALNATTTVLRVSTNDVLDTTHFVNGLSGGAQGRMLLVLNVDSTLNQGISFTNEAAGSVAANRFSLPGAATYETVDQDAFLLLWDATLGRWCALDRTVPLSGIQSINGGTVLGRATQASFGPPQTVQVNPNQVLKADSSGNLSPGLVATANVATNQITNALLAQMNANTVKANASASTANASDLSVGTNTVLGRVAGNIVAAQAVNAQITGGAVGTVKGVAVGGVAGTLQDLTGAQVGEAVRRLTSVVDSTSTGSIATYALAATTTQIRFTGSGVATIHGIAATAALFGQTVEFHVEAGVAGSLVFMNESATAGAAGERLRTPSGQTLTLLANESVSATYYDNRWRLTGVGKAFALVADGDKGDITVSGTGTTYTIDADVVTNTKLANMAARTVKGRADAAGSGDPQDLDGLQLGAILRMDNAVADTTSTGALAAYVIASGTNNVTFNGNTVVLHGIVAPTERGQILCIRHIGAGTCTIVHESTTAAANDRIALGDGLASNANGLVLGSAGGTFNRSVVLMYTGSRWQRLDEAIGAGAVFTSQLANNAVDNTKAADMADATIKGRALGAGSGDPTDLTGVQAGQIVRYNTGTDTTLAPGTYNDLAIAAGPLVRYLTTADGDIVITGIAYGSSNSGGFLRFFAWGATPLRRFIFKHADAGSLAGNQIKTPNSVDYILTRDNDAVDFQYIGGRWQLIASFTRGFEVGDYLRYATLQDWPALAVGTYNNWAATEATKLIQIEPATAGDVTITGFNFTNGNTGATFRLFKTGAVGRVVLKHQNTGSSVGRRLNLPNGLDFFLQDAESSVDLQFISGAFEVVDAGLPRYGRFEAPAAITPSTLNDYVVAQSTQLLYIDVNGAGDLIFTGFAHGTNNAGARFTLIKTGSDGRIILKDNVGSAAANRIWTPNSVDYVLTGYNDAVTLVHNGFTWFLESNQITNARMATMAAATIKGRAEGAGTGDPQDLTPTQVASIIDGEAITWSAFQTFANGVALSAGVQTEAVSATHDITLAAGTVRLVLSSTADFVINSLTGAATAGRMVFVEHFRSSGTGYGRIVNNSGTAPANSAFLLPDSVDFPLGSRAAFVLVARDGFWRVIASTPTRWASVVEIEESTNGPFNDYDIGVAGHVMCSGSAGVFTGMLGSSLPGRLLVVSHQGAGYTELQHNSGSSAVNSRFFNGVLGKNVRIFDNETALYMSLDTATTSTTQYRWVLLSPSFPFANASDNAAGDALVHNGTNWVVASGGNSANVVLRGDATFGTVPRAALAQSLVQTSSPAAGTYHNVVINATTQVYDVTPTGDVIITGFAVNGGGVAGNTGFGFYLVKNGFSGRVILANNTGSSAGNVLVNSNVVDLVLEHAVDGVYIQYVAGRAQWFTVLPKAAKMRINSTGSWNTREKWNAIAGGSIALAIGDNSSERETNLTIAVSDGDKGDLTVSGSGATWTVDASAITTTKIADSNVTNAKLASMAQSTIKGRAVTTGSGSPTDLLGADVTAIIEEPTGSSLITWEDENFRIFVFNNTGVNGVAAPVFGQIATTGSGVWFSKTSSGTGICTPGVLSNVNGSVQIVTGAGSGNDCAVFMQVNSLTTVIDFDAVYQADFWVKPTANTSIHLRVGMGTDPVSDTLGTDAAYFQIDTATDTTWRTVTRASSTSSAAQSTGQTMSTTVVTRLTIRRVSASRVDFFLNGALVTTHTTNIPTVTVAPAARVKTLTTSTRSMYVDRVRVVASEAAMLV